MFLIKIFKNESRRKNEDRRMSLNPRYIGSERRNLQDRRSSKDRRKDPDRRSGQYYKLSDERKDTVDTIIDILEMENMKRR